MNTMLNDIIATAVAVAMSIGGAFGDLANFFTPDPAATPPPTSVTQLPPRPSAAANRDPFHTELTPDPGSPIGAVLGENTYTPPSPTTIINQPVVERIVERAVPFPFSPVTLNDLAALEARINARFAALAGLRSVAVYHGKVIGCSARRLNISRRRPRQRRTRGGAGRHARNGVGRKWQEIIPAEDDSTATTTG